jgi:hypothetical protein
MNNKFLDTLGAVIAFISLIGILIWLGLGVWV